MPNLATQFRLSKATLFLQRVQLSNSKIDYDKHMKFYRSFYNDDLLKEFEIWKEELKNMLFSISLHDKDSAVLHGYLPKESYITFSDGSTLKCSKDNCSILHFK